jgi:hypothetical protein
MPELLLEYQDRGFLSKIELQALAELPGGNEIVFYNFSTIFTVSKNPLPWSANLTSSPDGRTLVFAQYKNQSHRHR